MFNTLVDDDAFNNISKSTARRRPKKWNSLVWPAKRVFIGSVSSVSDFTACSSQF